MAEIPLEDDDLDAEAAAMAEAMGFSGFGTQRSKKRKFNPHADSVAGHYGPDDADLPPATTGANNAPLGQRRPMMNLPPPAASSGGGVGGGGDVEGWDAGEMGEVDGEVDEGPAGRRRRGGGGGDGVELMPEEMEGMEIQARVDAIVEGNPGPVPAVASLEPQQQPPPQTGGRGPRWSGPDAHGHGHGHGHGARAAGLPWWEGAWNPKLIEKMVGNPWERLEQQRGLEPRGTWPHRDGSTTAAGAGAAGGNEDGAHAAAGAVAVEAGAA